METFFSLLLITICLGLAYFFHQLFTYSTISYLGLHNCKYCDNLADFNLQENLLKNREIAVCQKCGHKIYFYNTQLYYQNIPSKTECHKLAKYIIENLLLFKNEFLETPNKKIAIEQWKINTQNFLNELKEYIKLNNYNENYSLQLYDIIYYKIIKRIFILNLRR